MASAGSEKLLKWVPVAVIAAGLVASATTAQVQIGANQTEILDLSSSNDELEDELMRLRLLLLEQQRLTEGEVKEMQGDIKLILRLLEQERGE